MSKPSSSSPSSYPESRLQGLRHHTTHQRQATVERLRIAIASLEARGEPVTFKTIRAESDLASVVIRRNPEAFALFHEHSTFLATKQEAARKKHQEDSQAADPFLAYKKPQLVIRLRQEIHRREEIEAHHRQLLEEQAQYRLKVAQLEAELAHYQSMLSDIHCQVHNQESKKDSLCQGEKRRVLMVVENSIQNQ